MVIKIPDVIVDNETILQDISLTMIPENSKCRVQGKVLEHIGEDYPPRIREIDLNPLVYEKPEVKLSPKNVTFFINILGNNDGGKQKDVYYEFKISLHVGLFSRPVFTCNGRYGSRSISVSEAGPLKLISNILREIITCY